MGPAGKTRATSLAWDLRRGERVGAGVGPLDPRSRADDRHPASPP